MRTLTLLFITLSFNSFSQKCKTTVSVDKFDGTKTTYTNEYETSLFGISEKIDKNGDTTFFVKIEALSTKPCVNEKGVSVLFEDGTRMDKPEAEITSEAYVSQYYSGYKIKAFSQINREELTKFSIKKMTDYKVHTITQEVNERFGKYCMKYASCILNSK